MLFQDLCHALPVSFTGDAINQLSLFEHACFDIKDWIWHIEVINGEKYCIVTGRQQLQANGAAERLK